MSSGAAAEVARERFEPVASDPVKLRKAKPRDLGIRFAFGAGIALAAGLVGLHFGHLAGGMFLAFPTVLPASLHPAGEERRPGQGRHRRGGGDRRLLRDARLRCLRCCRPPAVRPVVALGVGASIRVVVSVGLLFAVRFVLDRRF